MKNIHMLPTDQPSRLGYLTKKGKEVYKDLRLFDRLMPNILDSENQNIYITSDEEIKEGDWQLSNDKHTTIRTNSFHESDKKIILTTDQDLIEDGVQSIDTDFLEWFVENPSCEQVEVERDSREVGGHNGGVQIEYGYYEVIIPSKEPKQETINKK